MGTRLSDSELRLGARLMDGCTFDDVFSHTGIGLHHVAGVSGHRSQVQQQDNGLESVHQVPQHTAPLAHLRLMDA